MAYDDDYDDDDPEYYTLDDIRSGKILALSFTQCKECGHTVAVKWTPDGAGDPPDSCDQHSMTNKERAKRSARLAAQAQPKEAPDE